MRSGNGDKVNDGSSSDNRREEVPRPPVRNEVIPPSPVRYGSPKHNAPTWQRPAPAPVARAQVDGAPDIKTILEVSATVVEALKQKFTGLNATVTHTTTANSVTYTASYTENGTKKTSAATLTFERQANGSTLFVCKSDRSLTEQYNLIALQLVEARKKAKMSLDSVTITLPDVVADADRANPKFALKSSTDKDEKKTLLSEREFLAIQAFWAQGIKEVVCHGKTYREADNTAAARVQVGEVDRPQQPRGATQQPRRASRDSDNDDWDAESSSAAAAASHREGGASHGRPLLSPVHSHDGRSVPTGANNPPRQQGRAALQGEKDDEEMQSRGAASTAVPQNNNGKGPSHP